MKMKNKKEKYNNSSLLCFLFESRARVRVILGSHSHISVTSDDTVIVIVTQSCGHIEQNKRF